MDYVQKKLLSLLCPEYPAVSLHRGRGYRDLTDKSFDMLFNRPAPFGTEGNNVCWFISFEESLIQLSDTGIIGEENIHTDTRMYRLQCKRLFNNPFQI